MSLASRDRSDTKAKPYSSNASKKIKALFPHSEKTMYVVVPFFTVPVSQKWYT